MTGLHRIPTRRACRHATRAGALALLLLTGCVDGAPTPAPPAADRWAGLPVRAAMDSSNARMLAHRYDEALEFLEHIARAGGGTSADFEGGYATALGNVAFQARVVGGVPIPVTRSSVERVAHLREAFARVDHGLRISNRPDQRRNLAVVRAGQLHNWGFVRDSYAAFWIAHEMHPLEGGAASEALGLERLLLDPIRGLDGARAPGDGPGRDP